MLSVKNISKTFDNTLVLDDVSLDVCKGKITAIIGANGAGKSTLLNLIGGDFNPDIGNIYWNKKDISLLKTWERANLGIGRIFQEGLVFGELSVLENILIACLKGKDQTLSTSIIFSKKRLDYYESQAKSLLEKFALQKYESLLAKDLSWGNKKLLCFAQVFAKKYNLVLFDEPFAGLSKSSSEKLQRLVSDLASEGVSVLLIEHDIELVKNLADNVVVLSSGKVINQGEVVDVVPQYIKSNDIRGAI